jgi:hypothetical protein
VADIKGALTGQVIIEYLQIRDLVDGLILQHIPDHYGWKLYQDPTQVSLRIMLSSLAQSNLHGSRSGEVSVSFSFD